MGIMQIRSQVMGPRKASGFRDYAKAVAEWDANVDLLKSYAGGEDALPKPADMLVHWLSILASELRKYVHDELARRRVPGQYHDPDPTTTYNDMRQHRWN